MMQPNHRPSPHEYSSSFSSSETGSPGPTIKYEEGGYDRKPRTIERRPAPASEMESLRRELEDSRQRIDRDTDVINSLHEKVTKLEELVEKQRMTIATQSKTISDRRGLRKHQQQQQQQQQQQSPMRMFPMTPSHHHHHVPQYHYPVSGSGSGAPTVSGPGSSAAAAAGVYAIQHPSSPLENQIQGQAQTPQSATSLASTAQSGGTVFDQPPPKFEIPIPLCTSYSAYTGVVPSGLAHCSVADLGGSNLSTAKDVFTPLCLSANNGTAPTSSKPLYSCSADYHKEMGDFSTRFLALMRMSEIFGQTHASLPNIFMDSHLDDKVKNYLMVISSRGQASVLVGNSATRGFFVAKAINWYLIDKILKVTVISGFNASVDREISLIQKQMTSETPQTVRHLMLTAITTHLTTLTHAPRFTEFAQAKIRTHLDDLWTYIGPLGHDPSTRDQMRLDLAAIISEAQSLALDMYSVPLEYRFEFSEPAEHFDPETMINRDPYVHGDPQVLKNSDARVRLGITPIVRIRNNAVVPGEVKLMYLGHVLLKTPRKHS